VRRRPKYRNTKVEADGFAFDSKAEARVWADLKVRERCGEIVQLQRQVPFRLAVNGEHVCAWIADFTWVEVPSGEFIAADVKSAFSRTLPVYRLKRKLFRSCMGFDITEMTR
jgi:hypothetical protein